MTKTYCDRCGKETEHDQKCQVGLGFRGQGINHVCDVLNQLCPTCYQALLEWMKGEDE